MATKRHLVGVIDDDGPEPKRNHQTDEELVHSIVEIRSEEEEDFYGFESPETPSASVEEVVNSGIPEPSEFPSKTELHSRPEKPMDSPVDSPAENIPQPDGKSVDVVRLLAEDSYWRGNRSVESENIVLKQGRPTPTVIEGSVTDEEAKKVRISICEFSYRKIPWLTGSWELCKYFCWPCLLFADERANERWNLPCDSDWKESSLAILKHQMSAKHVQACRTRIDREQSMVDGRPKPKPKSETVVRNNRRVLELLIRILCSKKTKFHNTDKDLDGYAELMKAAISHDPELERFVKDHFEDGVFGFVSAHAENVLTSIEQVIYLSTQKEILECPHVTLIYEDTLNIVDLTSNVAVIARYVTDTGEVRERFLKFLIVASRSLDNIRKHHISLLREFMLESKLLGLSFSGTVINPPDFKQLKNFVSIVSPNSMFFFCPDHDIKELLIQSLSHIEQSRYFFQVISDLVSFFSSNTGAIPTLVNFVKTSDPGCPWLYAENSFTHEIVSTLHYSYPLVLQFFKRVSTKFWNDEIARQAPKFVRFLTKCENKFLIVVVAAVLNCVGDVTTATSRGPDWSRTIAEAVKKLENIASTGLSYFMVVASSPDLRRTGGSDDLVDPELFRLPCIKLFKDIIDTATSCFVNRFVSSQFHVGKPSYGLSDVIKDPAIWKRYDAKPSELSLLRKQIDGFRDYEMIFINKTLPECLKLMHALELTQEYTEYQNFLRFCILLCPTEASPHSAVSRLKSYVKDKRILSTRELLLHLERDFITESIKDDKFIDEVIAHFATHNNEPSFLYD